MSTKTAAVKEAKADVRHMFSGEEGYLADIYFECYIAPLFDGLKRGFNPAPVLAKLAKLGISPSEAKKLLDALSESSLKSYTAEKLLDWHADRYADSFFLDKKSFLGLATHHYTHNKTWEFLLFDIRKEEFDRGCTLKVPFVRKLKKMLEKDGYKKANAEFEKACEE